MAQDNVEVEIKVKVTKRRFESTKKKLSKIAKKTRSSHHIDYYYDSSLIKFMKPKYPFEWLTIRARDGKVKLNYKHWYPEGIAQTTHCDEYETELTDLKSMEKILKSLRFKNFITIDKKRETYEYKNEFEIALDRVKGLGYFIEVESIKNTGGVIKAHKKLIEFLREELGISQTKTIPGGYVGEILRKQAVRRK